MRSARAPCRRRPTPSPRPDAPHRAGASVPAPTRRRGPATSSAGRSPATSARRRRGPRRRCRSASLGAPSSDKLYHPSDICRGFARLSYRAFMAVFLRKFLRIGRLPGELRAEVEAEGLLFIAEYVAGHPPFPWHRARAALCRQHRQLRRCARAHQPARAGNVVFGAQAGRTHHRPAVGRSAVRRGHRPSCRPLA